MAQMVQPSREGSQGWYQQQDYEPQRQTMDAGVAAFEGQQVQGVPLQTQTFQTRAQQTGGDQELPYCSHCLGRHWGPCWTYGQQGRPVCSLDQERQPRVHHRSLRVCYTCRERGHMAVECPTQYQQPQYQTPPWRQPQYQQRPPPQPQRGSPAPPQRPLLATLPAQPQGHQLRGGQQPRARQG